MNSNLYIHPSENVKNFYENHDFSYEGDSGLDLYFPEDLVIPARTTKLIDLEVKVELRSISKKITLNTSSNLFENKSMFLMARSSIYKTPLRIANSVGLIDSGYRGNIKVPVDNISEQDYTIKRGDKICQLTSPTLEPFNILITNKLSETSRSEKGFGSSDSKK